MPVLILEDHYYCRLLSRSEDCKETDQVVLHLVVLRVDIAGSKVKVLLRNKFAYFNYFPMSCYRYKDVGLH